MPRAPEPPAHLTEAERELFADICKNAPFGLFASIDALLLGVFCQHTTIHRRAIEELNAMTIKTPSSMRPHPLITIASEQAKLLLTMAEALGLTAAARQRIKLPAHIPAADKWADLKDQLS